MTEKKVVGTDKLIQTIQACIADSIGPEHEKVLSLFRGPDMSDSPVEDVPQIRDFVLKNHQQVEGLLKDQDAKILHLGTYALGFSGDERSVEPLVAAMLRRDGTYNHNYCFSSIFALGELALKPLYEIAVTKKRFRFAAIQAFAYAGGNPLPWLHRLTKMEDLHASVFHAYGDLYDPKGLPDLEVGLWHADPTIRGAAIGAASTLLFAAHDESPETLNLIDKKKWAEQILKVLISGEFWSPSSIMYRRNAIDCLGELGDIRSPGYLYEVASSKDVCLAVRAVRSLGMYKTEETRKVLIKLMDCPEPERACRAAAELCEDDETSEDIVRRAQDMMLRFILILPSYYGSSSGHAACAMCDSDRGRQMLLDCVFQSDEPKKYKALLALRGSHLDEIESEFIKLMDHTDPSVVCAAATLVSRRESLPVEARERAKEVMLLTAFQVEEEDAWFGAALELSEDPAIRRILYHRIEEGDEKTQQRAIDMLLRKFDVDLMQEDGILQECSSKVAEKLRKAWEDYWDG